MNKDELPNKLAGALVAIFVGCIIIILILVNLPNTKELDGALIANVLTGGVTLFTPIAAYYWLDSWKDQKKYELEKEQLSHALNQLAKISTDLYKSRSDIHQISKVTSQQLYVPSFLKRKEFDHVHELFVLYGFLNNYCQIKDNNDLIELYNVLEKQCYFFYDVKISILYYYKAYIEKLEKINPSLIGSLESSKSYDSSKEAILDEISNIKLITDFEKKFETKDKYGKILATQEIKPYDLVNEIIKLTNTLIKECNSKSLP